MTTETLIPKDKFDYETVDRLKSCSYDQIESIIPELLEWLQDMNWPISQPIAEYLLPFFEKIAPEILKILQGKDEVWKYWMLVTFGKITKDKLVLEEINRIAKNPTQEEADNEVSEIANEIIN
ncbi:DUF5071 domain-containing protein [Flavobacterium aquidurense]|uniref:DUF5071 domain-containing protein n=1 Tax=Flavobacterium aquidurense TaxID=362413 RepID=UPI00371453F1